MNRCLHLSAAVLSFVLAAGSAPAVGAADWPTWRGPNGDGTSPETNLPLRWSRAKNVLWRLPLPGPAGATPVVSNGKIFLTSVDGEDLVLIAVSVEGRELWRRKLGTGNRNVRGDEGNFASPSPVTDGKHVWAFVGTGDLACYDFEGALLWKANLQERYGKYDHWFGMTSTPLLHEGTLYLMCIQMQNPYIAALDALTGKERWRRSRPSDADFESRHSYASPMLYRDSERKLLLIHGADYISAHRLEDGREVWRCDSLNPRSRYNRTLRFIASPVSRPGLVVAPSAKGGPVLGIRPDGEGDITETHVIWERGRDTPDVPTPALHDGLVYLLRENGVLIVLEAENGEEVYQKRIHRTRQRASPVVADGKVYCASRDGTVYVVRAGRKFEVLAENAMEEPISSTPAIAGGRIYLRTFEALYAVAGGRGTAEEAGGGF